jgi:hypothetical protein
MPKGIIRNRNLCVRDNKYIILLPHLYILFRQHESGHRSSPEGRIPQICYRCANIFTKMACVHLDMTIEMSYIYHEIRKHFLSSVMENANYFWLTVYILMSSLFDGNGIFWHATFNILRHAIGEGFVNNRRHWHISCII